MTPVVFDLDGTLVDSLPSIRDAANAALSDMALPPLSDSTVTSFVGGGERVFVDKLLAHFQLEHDRFDDVLARFMRHYVVTSQMVDLFPGALSAVQAIRAAGHPTALCTNKPAAATKVVLKAAGLAEVMDFVVAGDVLPTRKPDPAPLLHIMQKLGAPTCLYVGDSEIDAETASRANQPFFLYTQGIRTSPIEAIAHTASFSDFAVLPDLVGQHA